MLDPLRARLPELRIVLEHVTTSDGVAYVREAEANLAGTITAHHLVINRTHMLAGGIRPHYYCLPVAKRETHRRALVEAATSGDARFFLGTDSAPHVDAAKLCRLRLRRLLHRPRGAAASSRMSSTQAGALDRLEAFVSLNGPALLPAWPPNEDTHPRRAAGARRPDGPVTVFDPASLSESGPITVFDPGFEIGGHVEEDA